MALSVQRLYFSLTAPDKFRWVMTVLEAKEQKLFKVTDGHFYSRPK
ncbi:MAG: hypothetical protein ACK5CA_14830 [Cyanobacteriota bacterium]|jgi:hypothetical protein